MIDTDPFKPEISRLFDSSNSNPQSVFEETDEDDLVSLDDGFFKFWTALVLGMLGLVLLTTVGVWQLGKRRAERDKSFDIGLRGHQVASLQPGSPIQLAGLEVGYVGEVKLVNEQPEAVLRISPEIAQRLPGDSRFSVEPVQVDRASILGVRITPGNDYRARLPQWIMAEAAETGGIWSEVSDSIKRNLGLSYDPIGELHNPVDSLSSRLLRPIWIVPIALGVLALVAVRILRSLLPLLLAVLLALGVAAWLWSNHGSDGMLQIEFLKHFWPGKEEILQENFEDRTKSGFGSDLE